MAGYFHSKAISQVFKDLETRDQGLRADEVVSRQSTYGLNALPEAKVDGIFTIFIRQFKSPLIYILLGAGVVIYTMGEPVDAGIILAVLVFNAAIGAIQEGKAQNTLRALRQLSETRATVVRGGEEVIVSDREVVPGDIVILSEGEKIPADARVIFSQNLKLDEAALTGESEAVHKTSDVVDADALVADQTNMVFKGTHIVSGRGSAVVVATGLATEIGAIAREVSLQTSEVPLKANIEQLSKMIMWAVGVISVVLFVVGIFVGKSALEMFATVVSLAVSVIPEGLPIVLTLVLASGVWRMSKRHALVKKLQAVEALGQAQVIAVDKTGTITKNELVVQRAYTNGQMFSIGGVGYDPVGDVSLEGGVVEAVNHPELLLMGKVSALNSNARVFRKNNTHEWQVSGDPTEAAIYVFSQKIGFHKDTALRENPLVEEIAFDYRLKYRATVHRTEGKDLLLAVGAPEILLGLCSKVLEGGKAHKLTSQKLQALEDIVGSMSGEGLRVVALVERSPAPKTLNPEQVNDMTLVGFLGMKDALRSEVHESLDVARTAGVRVVMITGDHKATATTIAREAGIYKDGDTVLTGQDIEQMSEEILAKKLGTVSVFARVTPEHKLRIVNAYKMRGETIAMTGDGVNDAPSLVAADLGVSMGRTGTEVAKEASDIVLLDDNFKSIVSAIEEGRAIYKTIKKVILYLFSTSMGEVFVIAGALVLVLPLPILPTQIIWLNFVTDGFLVLALAMEPKEKGLLARSFVRPGKYFIDRLMSYRMLIMALPMAVGSLYLFLQYYETDMVKAWTVSLTVLAVFQWFNVWNCRSGDESIFTVNPFANKFLFLATGIVLSLQLLAVYNPVLQKVLHTAPLSLGEWGVICLVASSIVVVEEIRKFFYRRMLRREVVVG